MAFWRPGAPEPGLVAVEADRETEDEGGRPLVYNPYASKSIAEQRRKLPIHQHRSELMYLLEHYRVVVLVGETGCGKTTQIPQYLREYGWAEQGLCVACTQPRRVACITVAMRVADEMGCTLGQEVGYNIRYDHCYDPQVTRIKYLTDGMLIQEMMMDPLLSRYSVVMVDEAHERGLYTDIILGLLKKILKRRPALRIIVASATMDAQELADYFQPEKTHVLNMEGSSVEEEATLEKLVPGQLIGKRARKPKKPKSHTSSQSSSAMEVDGGRGEDAPIEEADAEEEAGPRVSTEGASLDPVAIMSVKGRVHPVDIHYLLEPTSDYLQCCFDTVLQIHKTEPLGDILVFLTGQEEIETLVQQLQEHVEHDRSKYTLLPLPLYSGLPHELQMQVFRKPPRDTRKVILATNIAETSVTIDGILFVVDCGFAKGRFYDPTSNVERLIVTPVSKAQAVQRAGRAGRTQPGKCYRLYCEQDYLEKLPDKSTPEIQRSDLASVVIQLKALGIDNVAFFDFLSPPPSESMIRAMEVLYSLSAIDLRCQLTPDVGLRLAEFPLDPLASRMVFASHEHACSDEIITIAAALSVQSLWIMARSVQDRVERSKKHFAVKQGDHITVLNVMRQYLKKSSNRRVDFCRKHFLNARTMERAAQIREQLLAYAARMGVRKSSCGNDVDRVLRTIVCGYFAHAARRQPDNSYRSIRGDYTLYIHPSSVLFKFPPPCVLYSTVVQTSKDFMRDVSEIEEDWLVEMAPHFYDLEVNSMVAVGEMEGPSLKRPHSGPSSRPPVF